VREIVTDPEYLDVSLPAGRTFTHPTRAGHTVFAYVVEGEGSFEPGRDPSRAAASGNDVGRSRPYGEGTVVVYEPGDRIVVTTEKRPVRFLLVAGRPLREPVAWYGPIVMNTEDELRTAFREYEQGTFVKPAEGP
jgi:hypothetical protein